MEWSGAGRGVWVFFSGVELKKHGVDCFQTPPNYPFSLCFQGGQSDSGKRLVRIVVLLLNCATVANLD